MNAIDELQQWYISNCDGDWEHSWGISINTLDNPGWSLKINLCDTNLENCSFDRMEIDNGEDNWLHCQVEKNIFEGFGDSTKLIQLIQIFLDWAKSQNSDWLLPPTSEDFWVKEDRDFYDLLKKSPVTLEPCQKAGCGKRHLYYSVMCAEHHFEMVKNYRYPEIEEKAIDRERDNYWD